MAGQTQIAVSVEGGAGILHFARPEARNALTDTMLAETRAQMEAWEGDRAIAAGPCCTNRLGDSLRESSVIAGRHEQLGPYEV